MLNIPRVKRCPCCNNVNFIKVGKQTYVNEFKSLPHWILEKKFKCRKCKEEIGLFLNVEENFDKLIWLNSLKCEENYYDQLNSLKERKAKLGKKLHKNDLILTGALGPPIPIEDKKLVEADSPQLGRVSAHFV